MSSLLLARLKKLQQVVSEDETLLDLLLYK